MSETSLSRFTPSLLSPEALEALLVQRQGLANTIVEGIRESATTKNKHYVLLVGPRGIGKTHLVSLIYFRVNLDPDLHDRLLVAWLREEEWGVASYFDLLRVILRSLVERYDGAGLRRGFQQLLALSNPSDAEIVAEKLLRSAVGEHTLLVIAENFDEIFSGIEQEGQYKLRAFIQNNPFFTILATAQGLFNGVSLREEPFYGFFKTYHLSELSFPDALQLVTKIAEQDGNAELVRTMQTALGRARMRAVHHLAGGNPRVYVIFSQFLTVESLDHLVRPLMQTLDDLTPYYQSRMAHLSPQQRKIVEHLCDIRGATPVKEIAQACFITQQTASSQLRKLHDLGYVRSTQIGRESLYELREPLLRLTLDMKKSRGEPVGIVVDFLRVWYSPDELSNRLTLESRDASVGQLYVQAALRNQGVTHAISLTSLCEAEVSKYLTEGDHLHASEANEELLAIRGSVSDWLRHGDISDKAGRFKDAIDGYDRALAMQDALPEQKAIALVNRGKSKATAGDVAGALKDFTTVLAMLDAPVEQKARALFNRALAQDKLGDRVGAIGDYTALLSDVNSPSALKANALNNRANARRLTGEIDGALADYDVLLAIPDLTDVLKANALVYRGYAKEIAKDFVGEINDCTAALSIIDIPAELKAAALLGRAAARERVGDIVDVLEDYSAVLAMPGISSKKKARALANRGMAKGKVGDIQGEIDDYSFALALSDVSNDLKAWALIQRGIAKRAAGDVVGAVDDFTATLVLPSLVGERKAFALVNRGFAKLILSNAASAQEDFTAVLVMPSVSGDLRAQALIGRGTAKGDVNDVKGEIDDYSAVLSMPDASDERKASALIFRGNALAILGDAVAEMTDYAAVIAMRYVSANLRAWALVDRAAAKRKTGDVSGALADHSEVVSMLDVGTEEKTWALFARGNTKKSIGDISGAIDDFSSVLTLPNTTREHKARALIERGYAKETLGDFAGVIDDCTAALAVPDLSSNHRARALVNRGAAKSNSGDSSGAISDFSAVLAMSDAPDEPKAWALVQRGNVKGASSDIAGALDDYSAVLTLPGAPADQKARALVNRGYLKRLGYDLVGEIEDYNEALTFPGASTEQKARALSNRGFAKHAAGDVAGAIDDYIAVFAFSDVPSRLSVLARGNLALALFESGELSASLVHFEKATIEGSSDARIQSAYAEALMCLGRLDESIAAFERIRSLKPLQVDFDIESNYAAALLVAGRLDEGRSMLRTAIRQLSTDSSVSGRKIVIVRNLLIRTKERSEWEMAIREFLEAFAEHDSIRTLGQGLVVSISTLRNHDVTPAIAQNWCDIWRECAPRYDGLTLPTRLLEAATRFVAQQDTRQLYALPIEERRIIEPLLGVRLDDDF